MDTLFITYICSNCISIVQKVCKDVGQLLEPKLWQIVQSKLRKRHPNLVLGVQNLAVRPICLQNTSRAPIHRPTANKNGMECRKNAPTSTHSVASLDALIPSKMPHRIRISQRSVIETTTCNPDSLSEVIQI